MKSTLTGVFGIVLSSALLLASLSAQTGIPVTSDGDAQLLNLSAVNTPYSEYTPFITADEHFLFFQSNRPDGVDQAVEPAGVDTSTPSQISSAMRERSVGLGLMGFHSFLQQKGVPFESAMAKSWNMKMFRHIRRQSDAASVALAEERGACP